MNRHPLLLVPVLAMLAAPCSVSAEEGAEAHVDAVTLSAAVVKTFGIVSEPAQARSLADVILAPGWITYDPAGQAQVSSPVAGRVAKVNVQVGDQVKPGDALVELISPAYVEAQNAYVLKRTAWEATGLSVAQAEAALERGKSAGVGLSGAEVIRREIEVTNAKIAQLTANAERLVAMRQLRLLGCDPATLDGSDAGTSLSDTLVIRATAAGVVAERNVVIGQQVSGDAAPLITTADTNRLWVVANIPEAVLPKVTSGSRAELHAFSGERIGEAKIAQVTHDIDPHTRSGRARIQIAGSSVIRAGMYVQVRITPQVAADAAIVVAVPEAAVITHEGKTAVFIAEPHGDSVTFKPHPIMPGPTEGGLVPILKGLEAGEQVVVQGAFLLKADLGKEGAAHED